MHSKTECRKLLDAPLSRDVVAGRRTSDHVDIKESTGCIVQNRSSRIDHWYRSMHSIPLNLGSTLQNFTEKNRRENARHHLVAHCGKCDHGRRLVVASLSDEFGLNVTLSTLETEMVCPACGVKGGQILNVMVFV